MTLLGCKAQSAEKNRTESRSGSWCYKEVSSLQGRIPVCGTDGKEAAAFPQRKIFLGPALPHQTRPALSSQPGDHLRIFCRISGFTPASRGGECRRPRRGNPTDRSPWRPDSREATAQCLPQALPEPRGGSGRLGQS